MKLSPQNIRKYDLKYKIEYNYLNKNDYMPEHRNLITKYNNLLDKINQNIENNEKFGFYETNIIVFTAIKSSIRRNFGHLTSYEVYKRYNELYSEWNKIKERYKQ